MFMMGKSELTFFSEVCWPGSLSPKGNVISEQTLTPGLAKSFCSYFNDFLKNPWCENVCLIKERNLVVLHHSEIIIPYNEGTLERSLHSLAFKTAQMFLTSKAIWYFMLIHLKENTFYLIRHCLDICHLTDSYISFITVSHMKHHFLN